MEKSFIVELGISSSCYLESSKYVLSQSCIPIETFAVSITNISLSHTSNRLFHGHEPPAVKSRIGCKKNFQCVINVTNMPDYLDCNDSE